SDLDLLRQFEPVIRYTQGEMFFPCAVDGFLAQCSLWQKDAHDRITQLIDFGEVTPERLAEYDLRSPRSELFLRFTEEPLDPADYQKWLVSENHPPFQSAGRLARVGIVGRLAESLFDFSLLLRGRVPGGTTGRAALQYRDILAEDPRYVYYGRVLRDSGYVILHYLFFYVMNDWRSSFHGVNDHESDWEQIFVYLSEKDGEHTPEWVAFAAHDFSGDDLRRRWDDPELDKVDDSHVVVYAAAGSHAAYIEPGEYLMHAEPTILQPVKRFLKPVREFFAESLNTTGIDTPPSLTNAPLFSLAFVDYARGDGRAIGPGQTFTWSPELLSDELPWVGTYHGLWGLDTQDPFGGERAPAGPKFDRDGTVRHSWVDPLGWSGLDKVPAPDRLIPETKVTIALLEEDIEQTESEIAEKRATLRMNGLTVQALMSAANLDKQRELATTELAEAEKVLKDLNSNYAELQEKKRLLDAYLDRLEHGEKDDPQAHLRNRAVPETTQPKMARAMDFWAAASGALLVIAIVLLVSFRPQHWPLWIAMFILLFGFVEAALRSKATTYLLTTTIILAVIGVIALTISYWRWVIPAILIGIFLYSLLSNFRELMSRRPRT
ncbi:MAG: hypothetical protein R3C44_25085, partial [Chloroflexota bacterium]